MSSVEGVRRIRCVSSAKGVIEIVVIGVSDERGVRNERGFSGGRGVNVWRKLCER